MNLCLKNGKVCVVASSQTREYEIITWNTISWQNNQQIVQTKDKPHSMEFSVYPLFICFFQIIQGHEIIIFPISEEVYFSLPRSTKKGKWVFLILSVIVQKAKRKWPLK